MFRPNSSSPEIELFQTPLAVAAEQFHRRLESLSSDERAQAERYRSAKRRQAFVVGRATLRGILGRMLDMSPLDVPLIRGPTGKPRLAESLGKTLKFNVSHSQDWVVLGFSTHAEIGVDIEEYDPDVNLELIARNYFQPSERTAWLTASNEQRPAVFFQIWTCKEAAWKAIGQESAVRWNDIEVLLLSQWRSTIQIAIKNAEQDARSELPGYSWHLPASVISVVMGTQTAAIERPQVMPVTQEWVDQLLAGEQLGVSPLSP